MAVTRRILILSFVLALVVGAAFLHGRLDQSVHAPRPDVVDEGERNSESAPPASVVRRDLRDADRPPLPGARFRGRVVDESGVVLPGLEVRKQAPDELVVAVSAGTTDRFGEFSIDSITAGSKLLVSDGSDRQAIHVVQASDLLADRDAVEIVLSRGARASLRVRVVDAATPELSTRPEAFVVLTPAEINAQVPAMFASAGGDRTLQIREALGTDGVAAFARPPVNLRMSAHYLLGTQVLASIAVPPMVAGETREITIQMPARIRWRIRFIDRASATPIDWTDEYRFMNRVTFRYAAADGVAAKPVELRRWEATEQFSDTVDLPGPGRVLVEGSLRGYEPFAREFVVASEGTAEVELDRRRRMVVSVVDQDGNDLDLVVDDWLLCGPRTRYAGGSERCFMPRLTIRAFRRGEPIPPRLATMDGEQDWNRADFELGRSLRLVGRSRAAVFAPIDGGSVAAFVDGALAGVRPINPGDEEVVIALVAPMPSVGSMQFSVVDRETSTPWTSYVWRIEQRLAAGERPDSMGFRVVDAEDGVARIERIRAGDYRIAIVDPNCERETWWTDVTVTPNEHNDFGTWLAGGIASATVKVVDRQLNAIAGASVRIYHEETFEFVRMGALTWERDATWVECPPHGELTVRCRSGATRIEAVAPGYAPAAAALEVAMSGASGAVILLAPGVPVSISQELRAHMAARFPAGGWVIADAMSACEYFAGDAAHWSGELFLPPDAKCVVRGRLDSTHPAYAVVRGSMLELE